MRKTFWSGFSALLILSLLITAIACTKTVTPTSTPLPLTYEVTSASFTPEKTWAGLGSDCSMNFDVTIKNTDTRAGFLKVYFTYSSPSWVRHGEASVNIKPGEWQTANYNAGLMGCDDITDWHYEITAKIVP